MPRFFRLSVGVVLLAIVACPFASEVEVARAGSDVAQRFTAYYQQHDGLRLLGNPVSGLLFAYGYPAQYFEKARIEDHRGESANPDWTFAYGRLTAELMDSKSAANLSVSQTNIKYSDLKAAAAADLMQPPPPHFQGGTMPVGESGATFVPFDPALGIKPGYVVPASFWSYINRKDLFPGGWLHDVGLPMTNAMDATVVKGGQTRRISLQAFERTVLSYDPLNPPDFQVERANIGADALATQSEIGIDTTGQVSVPQESAQVTLPLHIVARLHDRYDQVEARLEWQDGIVLTDTMPVLWEGDSGLVIGGLDWLTEGAPPEPSTKAASLTIHPVASEVVLARQDNLTVLPPGDPGTLQIQVFWTNGEELQQVTETIPRTEAVGKAAIEALLWGPGPRAIVFPGLDTAIPTPGQIASYPGKQPDWGPRVTLRKLTIRGGVATVDLSQEINAYGGGAARARLIREQITQTLMQFASVHEVMISVEGQTAGVLQP